MGLKRFSNCWRDALFAMGMMGSAFGPAYYVLRFKWRIS